MSLEPRGVVDFLPPEIVPEWVEAAHTGIYLGVVLASVILYDSCEFLIEYVLRMDS